jgi:hypothetical protein
MRRSVRAVLPVLTLLACGCDGYRGPRLAISTNPAAATEAGEHAWKPVPPAPPVPTVYGGKTPEQWGQALRGSNPDDVAEACRALRVLAAEGRPFLFQGLDSTNPETRRLCLETLTLADFKHMSEPGRQKLVRLAGDREDMRIRERAALYLGQWHGSIPSP